MTCTVNSPLVIRKLSQKIESEIFIPKWKENQRSDKVCGEELMDIPLRRSEHSLVHSFICLFIHSFVYSFIHSLILDTHTELRKKGRKKVSQLSYPPLGTPDSSLAQQRRAMAEGMSCHLFQLSLCKLFCKIGHICSCLLPGSVLRDR